mgnify:CR=1 FL=1
MNTAKRPADTSISANWEVRALRNLRHLRENEHIADDEPAALIVEQASTSPATVTVCAVETPLRTV